MSWFRTTGWRWRGLIRRSIRWLIAGLPRTRGIRLIVGSGLIPRSVRLIGRLVRGLIGLTGRLPGPRTIRLIGRLGSHVRRAWFSWRSLFDHGMRSVGGTQVLHFPSGQRFARMLSQRLLLF